MESLLLYFSFALIAFMYASVGHGGASGYLALMALYAFPQAEIKTNALFLNLFVSLISFIQYYKKETFPLQLFLLLIIFSVPAAFVGGMYNLHDRWFKMLLAIVLLIPIAKFLGAIPLKNFEVKVSLKLIILFGISIGLLSGLLGIGGGIILSPILLLLGWCDVKQTVAVSALFIFVNSFAGLLGKSITEIQFSNNIFQLLITTILGAFVGAYLGSKKFKNQWIKTMLAVVLLIACIKLIFT